MTSQDPGQEPEAQPGPSIGPLRNRMGRLAILFVVVVIVGLAAITVLDRGATGDGSPGVGIPDPADLPRGALAGEVAPRFAITTFDGETFDLDGHITTDGRPIVLNFWASWCFPCREEMPEFDEVALAHPDVLFLGVAVDDNESPAREFADEVQVSYPLAIDGDGSIGEAYPHIGLPTTFFIAADGTVSRQVQGQVTKELLEALVEFDFG